MRIEHLFLTIATIGLVSIVALSNVDRPHEPGNASYITLKDARVGEIRIVKDCRYVPGKCYAPRGLGPWQEVDCDDPSPFQCGNSCMRANKDVCREEVYRLELR